MLYAKNLDLREGGVTVNFAFEEGEFQNWKTPLKATEFPHSTHSWELNVCSLNTDSLPALCSLLWFTKWEQNQFSYKHTVKYKVTIKDKHPTFLTLHFIHGFCDSFSFLCVFIYGIILFTLLYFLPEYFDQLISILHSLEDDGF